MSKEDMVKEAVEEAKAKAAEAEKNEADQKDPEEKAQLIIENCAHPAYRPLLRDYMKLGKGGHTPHCLKAAFGFHEEFIKSGNMQNTNWAEYCK